MRHFLDARPRPASRSKLDLARQFLPTITAAEVAALAREMITDDNRVVLASAPEKAGLRRGHRDRRCATRCAPG